MAKNNGNDGWEKVSGGGPWEGDLWLPQGPTEEAAARAEEYHNTIIEEDEVTGNLHSGVAFGEKAVMYLTNLGLKPSERKVLMPEHGGLQRDLALVHEKYGDGCEVRVVYKGTVVIKNGRHKGKNANAYDVFGRAAK